MKQTTKKNLTTNEAWEKLFKKYNIIDEIVANNFFEIEAVEIKEFREPRLMASFNTRESMPSIFKDNNINILPTSRGSYILGRFDLFHTLPEINLRNDMHKVNLPYEYETIDINNITSEAVAINVIQLTGILEDFLGCNKLVATFDGRMGSGKFSFKIGENENKLLINVDKAQIEIDAGFENEEIVVILEAKNVYNDDFNVRQLYYPFKVWEQKISKPMKLVFSVYSNMIFSLFEYAFSDPNDYSSIHLINHKHYSLHDVSISRDDIKDVFMSTEPIYNDKMSENKKDRLPFIQADVVERLISLMEHIDEAGLSKAEIAELMEFGVDKKGRYRQSDYYANAGKYLGIFDIVSSKVYLTSFATNLLSKNFKERQLGLVKKMFEHLIFKEIFESYFENGHIYSIHEIVELMLRLNCAGDNRATVRRRATTVNAWCKWIRNLIVEE